MSKGKMQTDSKTQRSRKRDRVREEKIEVGKHILVNSNSYGEGLLAYVSARYDKRPSVIQPPRLAVGALRRYIFTMILSRLPNHSDIFLYARARAQMFVRHSTVRSALVK